MISSINAASLFAGAFTLPSLNLGGSVTSSVLDGTSSDSRFPFFHLFIPRASPSPTTTPGLSSRVVFVLVE